MIGAFTVPGPPIPKARPRQGKNGIFYTPKRSRDAEALVAERAALCGYTYEGPVKVEIDFYGGRGDIDNLAKTVLDGMQKAGVFSNDSQVQQLMLRKFKPDPGPVTEVHIWPIEGGVATSTGDMSVSDKVSP